MKVIDQDLLMQEADRLLDMATTEMQHSEEDVASYMVCFNSRQSIVNYLSYFILKNGEEIAKPVSVANLLDQCKKLDARFDLVDISPIYCNEEAHSEEYCLDVNKVNECLVIAQQTRKLALDEAPAY